MALLQRLQRNSASFRYLPTPATKSDLEGPPLTPAGKLKKERDEKMKQVVAKVLEDLDDIKHQAAQEREARERQRLFATPRDDNAAEHVC